MWCTWAPESKCRDRNTNCDIFRLMFASVCLHLSWLPFLHCKCCKNSLGVPTWSSTCWRPVRSSPYLSKCLIHSVKEEVQTQTPSSEKTTYSGPLRRGPSSPVPLYLDKEKLWRNIAMQIQVTMPDIWKWTYLDILLIRHALVKRQNICRVYFIWIKLRLIPLRLQSFVCCIGVKPDSKPGSGNLQ